MELSCGFLLRDYFAHAWVGARTSLIRILPPFLVTLDVFFCVPYLAILTILRTRRHFGHVWCFVLCGSIGRFLPFWSRWDGYSCFVFYVVGLLRWPAAGSPFLRVEWVRAALAFWGIPCTGNRKWGAAELASPREVGIVSWVVSQSTSTYRVLLTTSRVCLVG